MAVVLRDAVAEAHEKIIAAKEKEIADLRESFYSLSKECSIMGDLGPLVIAVLHDPQVEAQKNRISVQDRSIANLTRELMRNPMRKAQIKQRTCETEKVLVSHSISMKMVLREKEEQLLSCRTGLKVNELPTVSFWVDGSRFMDFGHENWKVHLKYSFLKVEEPCLSFILCTNLDENLACILEFKNGFFTRNVPCDFPTSPISGTERAMGRCSQPR